MNLRKSSRISKLPAKLNDFVLNTSIKYGLNKYVNHYLLNSDSCCFVSNLNKTVEPTSYEEASKNVNLKYAMNDEIHALHENDTWEEVELPLGRTAIGSKWVWKIKYKSTVKWKDIKLD